MFRGRRLWAFVPFLLLGFSSPSRAQGFRSIVQPAGRAFPAVGPGVSAIKRDNQGRYYVLAKPATRVRVFNSDGALVAEFPPANSPSSIVYAMDFDVAADGSVYIADRGGNAVLIFRPDGSLLARVAVFAPTSVVALSNREFAVASFHASRLVEVFNDRGVRLRTFGDPSDAVPAPIDDPSSLKEKEAPLYLGRIYGDPEGQIYFTFTSLPDPTFRRYDRYGYVAYEAVVSEDQLVPSSNDRFDRFQFGFNFNRFDLADQFTGSASVGSSGDVHFGGGLGAGLGAHLGGPPGGNGGFGRGGGLGGGSGSGFGGGAGMLSAQASVAPGTFHVMVGNSPSGNSSGRGPGGNSGGSSSGSASPDLDGGVLQFAGTGSSYSSRGSSDDIDFAQLESTDLFSSASVDYSSALSPDNQNPSIAGDLSSGSPVDQFNQLFLYNRLYGGGGFGGPPPGAGGHREGAPGGASGASGSPEEFNRYGPHGHFGRGVTGFAANVRINLDKPIRDPKDKPEFTAFAVDPDTEQVWAAVNDSLVLFDNSGNPQAIFTLVTSGDQPLRPTALLVERDRILVASDPWGIFVFARPDSYLHPAVRASAANSPPQP